MPRDHNIPITLSEDINVPAASQKCSGVLAGAKASGLRQRKLPYETYSRHLAVDAFDSPIKIVTFERPPLYDGLSVFKAKSPSRSEQLGSVPRECHRLQFTELSALQLDDMFNGSWRCYSHHVTSAVIKVIFGSPDVLVRNFHKHATEVETPVVWPADVLHRLGFNFALLSFWPHKQPPTTSAGDSCGLHFTNIRRVEL
ncbi:hypothetical protein EYF80_032018 [Liparis tanakae]|uniref:Uncharacterized protein n=1 Tax=Liparis tanakae TaxID=230148 RepID=A0A4Z2GWW1_9TELE|nr:hypothetical protein EYF80_032018 [Liparis tanakae]